MKFLFDQNISFRILKSLPDIFAESSHVKKENLINSPDREIWEFARRNSYIIVAQDSDFNNLNALYGFPPKVIWIRTGNLKTQSLIDILLYHSSEIEKFIVDDTFGCFEIIRIRKK